MLGAALLACLVIATPRTQTWQYAYENMTGSQRVYVSQHFYDDLVKEKWCVKVYVKRDDTGTINICVI